jgi:hypothetical protein
MVRLLQYAGELHQLCAAARVFDSQLGDLVSDCRRRIASEFIRSSFSLPEVNPGFGRRKKHPPAMMQASQLKIVAEIQRHTGG